MSAHSPISSAPATAAPPRHLQQLDVLRGLAIIGVLLFHCLGTIYYKDELPWAGNWRAFSTEPRLSFYLFYPLTFGWIGVAIFFVLSGFVIHYSHLRKPAIGTWTFYERRFWRIYPPYLLALLAFTALSFFQGQDRAWLMKQFFTHAFMAHNFDSKSIYEICPAFWSLATEVQFYLLYPLVLAIRARAGANMMLAAAMVVSTISQIVFCLIARSPSPDSAPMAFATSSLWFDWVLGAYVAELFLRGERLFAWPKMWAAGLTVLFVGSTFYRPLSGLSFTIACVMGAVLLELAVWSRRPFGVWQRGLAWLGICSYSFYLWHQPVLPLLVKGLRLGGPHYAGAQLVILFVVALGVISLLSFGLYRAVERPSQQLGKRASRPRQREYALELASAPEGISSSSVS